jgi:CDP-6-deoxy-D-xylo-4-hexulose-3-dehydrase
MDRADELRKQITALVAEFYREAHAPRPFVPGETRIHYAGRVYDERELAALVDASLDFWLTLGENGLALEEALAEFLGVAHVVLVNSGSSANLVAVATLCSAQRERPLRAGDEVITPAATFPTTVAPLVQHNLVPVFVDCEPGTYNVDPGEVEKALSERTRAILLPHMLGNASRMDRVMEVVRAHDLILIEDVCEAMGTRFAGRMLGTWGSLSTFSFYPPHHMTMGEGGAVATDDGALAKTARSIRDWGRDCWCSHRTRSANGACGRRFSYPIPGLAGTYDHKYLYSNIGYSLRPTDMQAALGLVQLAKLPAFVEARQRNFRALYQGLSRFQDALILPAWYPQTDVSWFAFPITVRDNPRFTRNDLVGWLEAHNIETRFLMAGNILRQPAFVGIPHRTVGSLEHTELVMRGAFFVGVYPGLDWPRLDYMLEQFEAFFAQLP